MSPDIYKDLVREHDRLTLFNAEFGQAKLLWEAAEEISRLRAALTEARRAAHWRAKRKVKILEAEIARLHAAWLEGE